MGVANQRVIVRQLDLPWMERAELRSSLAFQVQDFLPMPIDTAVLDFFPLEEVAGESGSRMLRGLLVAAARETVLANVTCAENAGLTVDAVDLTSFAVLRAMGRQTGLEVETEALIDIGARVTNVVVHSAGAAALRPDPADGGPGRHRRRRRAARGDHAGGGGAEAAAGGRRVLRGPGRRDRRGRDHGPGVRR